MSLGALGRRTVGKISVALALGVAALASVAAAPPEAPPPPAAVPDSAWSASFKDLAGTQHALSEWKGQIAVVYFLATWCAPCHREAPALQTLYDKYRDKGVVVVGLAVDNADKVRDFVKKYNLTYPVIYGGTPMIELGRSLGNSLGGIPFLVVIDREGKIVERITGDTKEGRIEGVIAPLLAG